MSGNPIAINSMKAEIRHVGAGLLELEGGHRWYTIQTKPGKEPLVESRLRDLKLEVFLPWLRAQRRTGTRYQKVLVPLFPGYLFCCLDLLLSGKAARYAAGVKDFVRFGNRIPEIEAEVIQALRNRCRNGVAEIQRRICEMGGRVMIRDGALSGLEGIFEREMGGRHRVAVLLEILGRRTRVVLSSEMIDPI